MPVESFAGFIGVAWWSQDSQMILEKLQSAEALLAFLAIAVIAAVFAAIRQMRSRGPGSSSDGYEIVRLTSQGPLVLGSKTRLTVMNDDGNTIAGLIEEMDRRWVTVSVPFSEAPRLRPGVSVEIMTPAGSAAYRFTAGVQDRRKREDCLLIFFDRPTWVERVQRRQFFRVPLEVPTIVNRIDAGSPTTTAFRAVLNDLSGGGMTVSVPFRPPFGALLRVRIPLPSLKNSTYEVRVIRSAHAKMSHGGMWAVGCEFLYMEDFIKEQVMRACFEEERAAKAKAQ